MSIRKFLTLGLVASLSAVTGAAFAQSISVNFTESAGHANQQIALTNTAGLNGAANWNNTTAGGSGVQGSLLESTGAPTGATVTWSSAGVWGDGTADPDANLGIGDAQLARGYLDENPGPGVSFTVTSIPYLSYDVVLYLSTDTEGGTYLPFTINGTSASSTGTKSLYGNNPNWDASNTVQLGGLSGDLTVTGPVRNGPDRASVAGFQIVVPEPTTAALLGLGGLALLLRRRK